MIKINNLKKNYPGFNLDITMQLPKGHVSGIVGRNGAGKSTFIKAILGLIKPDSGEVIVMGKDSSKLSAKDKENIGVALAESGFSNYINIKAIIKILKAMYSRFDEDEFRRLLNEQQLPLDKPIKEFSTGMKAKLRVLSAMSHKADLLILDEPTAGLDVIARGEIADLLRSYLMENDERSILITSHISSDLEGLCDDIYMINNGEIILHEDTDVLLANYALIKVSESQYEKIDKEYIAKTKKTSFGYSCLTKEKQFYKENYPDIIIENGSIDELIIMLASDR